MDGVDEKDVVSKARDRFKHVMEFESKNREEALEALKFVEGEQWPDDIRTDRLRKNRPVLVINRIPQFVRQVVNDIRQIRPSVKARPVDSMSDVKTAEMLNGMIRAIEQDSSAEACYDWAAEQAVKSGFGYWRIVVDYVDDQSFDQCIKVERVRNQFAVYIDPASQAQDASDMRYAFVVERMPKPEFESKYPGKTSEWNEGSDDREWWFGEDYVRVAEYWEVVETEITLSLTELGVVEGEVEGALATRKSTRREIVQRIITGAEVLEENPYVGKYIPIVRVLGREADIQGELKLKGMVRDLMDPARQYNYMRSAAVERVALYAKAPYIGPKGAFKNPKWRSANTESYAYLEYDGEVPPRREPPPDISPGFSNEIQLSAEELKAVSGIHDPGLGARSNEVSGVAIDSRKSESDVSNYDFVDNLARAMTYSGKVLVDLIPKIYTGQRMVRILKPDEEDELVQLNAPYVDDQGKEHNYNLQAGKYDVAVDIGPAYATQRKEAAQSMMEILKIFPGAGEIIGDLVAKNFDWPGADEISKRLRALLPVEVLEGENPQLGMIAQQKDAEIQALSNQLQMAMDQLQQMQVALQNKDRENATKEGDLRRKIAKDLMDFEVDATKLEMDANKDMWPQGQYL